MHMKNSKLIYVLMSFLSFTILFGSFYFIVSEEVILGAILATFSLIGLLVTYSLLKKQYGNPPTDSLDNEEVHYEKVNLRKDLSKEIEAKQNFEEKPEEKIEEVLPVEKTEDIYEFDMVINEDFDANMMSFISAMIDQNMFLESYEFRYDQKEIRDHHLLGKNLYKYDFHPIPLISLIKDFKNTQIIKVMVGLSTQDMVHIGYVPQTDVDYVQENYAKIKNIKASLSGGTYRVLEEKSDMIRQYNDPFIVNLRVYL